MPSEKGPPSQQEQSSPSGSSTEKPNMATVQAGHTHNVERPSSSSRTVKIVRDWFVAYLDTLFQTGLFGGSITFTLLVVELKEVRENSPFSEITVRTFLSLAWAFFTMGLAASLIFKVIFYGQLWDKFVSDTIKRGTAKYGAQRPKQLEKIYFNVLFLIVVCLNCIPPLAFTFMSLAVSAYVGPVGWFMTAGSLLVLGLVLCLCILAKALGMFGDKEWRIFRVPEESSTVAVQVTP